MADVFSKSKRSEVMACIRSRGNKATEIAFVSLLRSHRITGWRRHRSLTINKPAHSPRTKGRKLTRVKPDFVFAKQRAAVFIDGCFWHGCPTHATKPESNSEFWHTKLEANRVRDRHVTRELRKRNWKVMRIWEHQLCEADGTMTRLKNLLERVTVSKAGLPNRYPPCKANDA